MVYLFHGKYRFVFEKPGMADINLIDQDRNEAKHTGLLMRLVMQSLLAEENDGQFTAKNVYLAIRSTNKSVSSRMFTVGQVTEMLGFLSSPIIGCVEKTVDGYYAKASLSDAANRFAFYANACNK